jgi:hypothetical protein
MGAARTIAVLSMSVLFALPVQGQEVRSIDGSGNSLLVPEMNAAGGPLKRRMLEGYDDGISSMRSHVNPRAVSNAVADQREPVFAPRRRSDYLWQWGQFLDHDISLTLVDRADFAGIPVPAGDPVFDPGGTGTAIMSFNRSVYASGTGIVVPRQQPNAITGWIDASQVYGSYPDHAAALRTNDGTGHLLRTSAGDLLPLDAAGFFVAGDVRVNEQIALTAMHTLFVREHNRLATATKDQYPFLSDEQVYQSARRLVGALIQAITYNEFIPALMGPHALTPYRGHNPLVDAGILNEFSTAAFRLGHSLLSPTLLRLDRSNREIPAGHVALKDAFFAPTLIVSDGIEPILRGLARQVCQRLDPFVIDDVRNFLFGDPSAGGVDTGIAEHPARSRSRSPVVQRRKDCDGQGARRDVR